MFKKINFWNVLLSILLSVSLHAGRIQLIDPSGNPNLMEEFGLAGLKNTIHNIDKKNAGEWYLYLARPKLFKKVKNNEFEYDDVVNESYSMLINEINKYQSLLNTKLSIVQEMNFSKYNFKDQIFPVSVKHKFYFENNSKIKRFVEKQRGPKIVFDNFNMNYIDLPMKKSDAKLFIKKRTDKNGNINRSLKVKYDFIIKKIESPTVLFQGCSRGVFCSPIAVPMITAHLKKIHILTMKNKVLISYKVE